VGFKASQFSLSISSLFESSPSHQHPNTFEKDVLLSYLITVWIFYKKKEYPGLAPDATWRRPNSSQLRNEKIPPTAQTQNALNKEKENPFWQMVKIKIRKKAKKCAGTIRETIAHMYQLEEEEEEERTRTTLPTALAVGSCAGLCRERIGTDTTKKSGSLTIYISAPCSLQNLFKQ
jgi:hypothetical protein